MISRPLRLMLVGALLVSSGVHVGILQGFAWARMAARSSLDKPCGICLTMRKASQSGLSLCAAPQSSPEVVLPSAPPRLSSRVLAWVLPDRAVFQSAFPVRPPSPPPRTLPS